MDGRFLWFFRSPDFGLKNSWKSHPLTSSLVLAAVANDGFPVLVDQFLPHVNKLGASASVMKTDDKNSLQCSGIGYPKVPQPTSKLAVVSSGCGDSTLPRRSAVDSRREENSGSGSNRFENSLEELSEIYKLAEVYYLAFDKQGKINLTWPETRPDAVSTNRRLGQTLSGWRNEIPGHFPNPATRYAPK